MLCWEQPDQLVLVELPSRADRIAGRVSACHPPYPVPPDRIIGEDNAAVVKLECLSGINAANLLNPVRLGGPGVARVAATSCPVTTAHDS
jgi:hypothetical protein